MHAVSEIHSIPPGRVSRPVMSGAGHHPAPAPDFSAMPWDELIAYIRVTPEAWSADPDEVPAFVLAHEERARRRGYSLAGQPRTRREFEALVRACRATLGLSDGVVSPVSRVQQVPSNVVVLAGAERMEWNNGTTVPGPRKPTQIKALSDLRTFRSGVPSQAHLVRRWKRSKATVCRWVDEWVRRGHVVRLEDGWLIAKEHLDAGRMAA